MTTGTTAPLPAHPRRHEPRRPATLAGLAALTVLLVAGCTHQHLARQRLRRREDTLKRTAALLVQREQSSPQRLARTSDWLARQLWPGPRKLPRLHVRLQRWRDEELNRHRRIRSTAGPWLERQLRGRPERIEPVAIRLFY